MAATFNQWGTDVDEGLGDIVEEKIEDKAKDEAKEAAEEAAKAAGKGLDKLTDKIDPVKKAKDQVKNLWHNNPIAKAKRAVKGAVDKAKQAVAKLAKQGIHAVGKAAVAAVKGAVGFLAAHPVVAVALVVGVIVVACVMDADDVDVTGFDESTDMQNSFGASDVDGMTDNQYVVLLMTDCTTNQFDMMEQIDVEKEEQAKLVYSMFRSYGFNNASIAGILGNMDCESQIDPTCVEGIMSRGLLSETKSNALVDLPTYTVDKLFPKYDADGVSYNPDGYRAQDAAGHNIYHCGIGIVQWTGPAAIDIRNTAQTIGYDWYNMEFQMAYLVADCFFQPGFFSEWVVSQEEDTGVDAAREAGYKFVVEFEGNESKADQRRDAAETWYNTIMDWGDDQVDTAFVDSVLALADELGAIVEFMDVRDAAYICMQGGAYDNSGLANAAVSFAWPTAEKAKRNNGTQLYQTLIDTLFGDRVYKACDRVVAAAVLWSGTDDSYPTGTSNQYPYLESSAKWEKIGTSSTLSIGELQPGDVFCVLSDATHEHGHTFIYTGEAMIQLAHGSDAEPGSNSVSGSYQERSAGCDHSATTYLGGSREYGVYRCIDPDESDTYTSIGSGQSAVTYN